MKTGDQTSSKKLLAVSIPIITLLFAFIVVLMMRQQRLRRELAEYKALPVLAEDDQKALSHLHAFGSILEDYGWNVYWNVPVRYEKHGTVQLVRGSFHHVFEDTDGAPVRLGIDALTFSQGAKLPSIDEFPLDQWRDLHPLRSFTEHDAFPWEVKRAARTIFVFYKYQGKLPSDLPSQLETFITGETQQRASFRRDLAQAHQREKDAREALETAQKALHEAELYEGNPDGKPGWRTKHALQRFLRRQGFYSGDIDGVFGNRTLAALHDFRTTAGLTKSDDLDLDLAKAIVEALKNPAPAPPVPEPSAP